MAKPLSQRVHRVLSVLNVLGATDHEQLPRRPGVMTKFFSRRTCCSRRPGLRIRVFVSPEETLQTFYELSSAMASVVCEV